MHKQRIEPPNIVVTIKCFSFEIHVSSLLLNTLICKIKHIEIPWPSKGRYLTPGGVGQGQLRYCKVNILSLLPVAPSNLTAFVSHSCFQFVHSSILVIGQAVSCKNDGQNRLLNPHGFSIISQTVRLYYCYILVRHI